MKFLLSFSFLFLFCCYLKGDGNIEVTGLSGASAQVLSAVDGEYLIDESLGQLEGTNLFHTFNRFGLDSDESARFTGSDTIENVISRVIGGEVSTIDGLLKSEIPNADFYFINPAGVLFGPHAKLELPGAFYVSTADYTLLGENDLFYSQPLENEVLSTAAPSAFGFLDDSAGTITVNGATLELASEETLSFIGGDIELSSSGKIRSEYGNINLVSVYEVDTDLQGLVEFNTDSDSGFNVTGFTSLGNIVLDDFILDLNGDLGGGLFIQGRNLTLRNDTYVRSIAKDGSTGAFGDPIIIDVDEHLQLLSGSYINVSTESSGSGGTATITAENLTIDRAGSDYSTGIISLSGNNSSFIEDAGDGGDLFVNLGGNLEILNGGKIDVSTYSSGNGGDAIIIAKNLTIDGGDNSLSSRIDSASNLSDDDSFKYGNGGNLNIEVHEHLIIQNEGAIDISTYSTGNGGAATIKAKNLTINDNESDGFTGIDASANRGSSGSGGALALTVENDLNILSGGRIDLSAFSSGLGGLGEITTNNLIIDGDSSKILSRSGENSSSLEAIEATGNGGALLLTVHEDLVITNGGVIDVSTFAFGNGGFATINAKNLTIDRGSGAFTGIDSASNVFSFGDPDEIPQYGNGGNLLITVNEHLQILNGGQIDVSTFTTGNGGFATINAKNLTIDKSNSEKFTGIDSASNSSDALDAFENPKYGNGGNISVMVSEHLEIINGGQIDVGTFTSGNSGVAEIRANTIIIDGNKSGIVSEASNFATGFGGDLLITALDSLQIRNHGRVSASTDGFGASGSVTIKGGSLILENGGQILSSSNFASVDDTDETSLVDNIPHAGFINIEMEGAIRLNSGSKIESASKLSNAGVILLYAGGDIEIDSSTIGISAGQGILDGDLKPNTRFTLDNPDAETLKSFLEDEENEVYFSVLDAYSSDGSIRLNNSSINAQAGLIAGFVRLRASDEIILDNSSISLEVDQRNMNLADVWNEVRDEDSGTFDGIRFYEDFSLLFSDLILEAENAIYLSDSTLTTNAGLKAKELDLATGDTSRIRGFGGSVGLAAPLKFPTQISLLRSRLEAKSYTMGGNVFIDPYYYIVNQSDVITSADIVGGDYIINAAFLLQSQDSTVDLSGQQSGNFISSAIEVDLGSELASLKADFLNLDSFVQASCDLYYMQNRSSLLIQPVEISPSGLENYWPSALPDYLYKMESTPKNMSIKNKPRNLPSIRVDCFDCI